MVKTSAKQRSAQHMGGVKRQIEAMMASRQSIIDRIRSETEEIERLSELVDKYASAGDSHNPEAMLNMRRLSFCVSVLRGLKTDAAELESRITQYESQLSSVMNIAEQGDLMDRQELGEQST